MLMQLLWSSIMYELYYSAWNFKNVYHTHFFSLWIHFWNKQMYILLLLLETFTNWKTSAYIISLNLKIFKGRKYNQNRSHNSSNDRAPHVSSAQMGISKLITIQITILYNILNRKCFLQLLWKFSIFKYHQK